MIFVIQRVTHADVTVENKVVGKIGHGLLVFVGVADFDNQQTADKMIDKMTKLRILRCMRTAKRETVRRLRKREIRIWRMRCMSILSAR